MCSEKTHISGCRRKRISYRLTSEGRRIASEFRSTLLGSGLDPRNVVTQGACTPGEMWIRLNEIDRNVFGLACTIGLPVMRSTLRPMTTDAIPVDKYGRVHIPKVMAIGFLHCAPEQKRIKWHSDAADYW